jgi:ABC-type transport system involved in multi-copper enzyme maturation permease subunit
MKRRLRMIRLPILTKDLLERAARKRTYVIRFVYGLILFVAACTLFYGNIGVSAEAGQSLGRGASHFAWLMGFLLAALYVLVPIIAAEAIASEKQRDTLVLLLVTTLTPRQIILQKFAARTASILSFVCLSFPLLAITYTFGGVTPEELVLGMVGLIVTCLQVGAFAILCSAYFQTTVQALAMTYLGVFAFQCCAFMVGGPDISFGQPNAGAAILGLLSIAVCLTMASAVLVDRAFVQARNYLLEFFRWLDREFESMNVLTGGIVLVRDRGILPQKAPVRWRETRKKSLGTFRYLFRVLVVLEVPILFVIQTIRFGQSNASDEGLTGLLKVLWVAAAALVTIHAASLISEERSRQTLSVLASTPLTSRRILIEKLFAVRRLIAILMVPFATIFLFEWWWYSRSSVDYVVLSVLTVVTYLSLIQWMALTVGLRFSNQLVAIVVAVSIVAVWAAGLALAVPLASYLDVESNVLATVISAFNPVGMILAIQSSVIHGSFGRVIPSPWEGTPVVTVVHFVFYWSLALTLRWWCLRTADRYLGRVPQPVDTSDFSDLQDADETV